MEAEDFSRSDRRENPLPPELSLPGAEAVGDKRRNPVRKGGGCMGGIAALLIVFVLVLAVKKPLLLRFYLQLAVGRTTKLLCFLQQLLTGSNKDDETERQIEWLHGQELQKTEIMSRDGLTLTGYYLEHPKAERIVLMFHGWRGRWDKDCAALAHGLYEKNASILMVNQQAHGLSEGRYIGFGVLERYDCQKWIEYLNSRTGELPIYLSGVSMGTSTVLMVAGEELPDCVKGVIADCGYTSPYEMVKIFAKKFMHMEGRAAEHTINEVNHMCRKKAGYDLRDYSTVEAMRRCRLPVFFAHGTEDHFVPYEMTLENYDACAGRKLLYTAEGASHTKSYITGPAKYMEALAEFFQWEPAYQM